MRSLLRSFVARHPLADIGLLLFRLVFGLSMALGHGWPKLQKLLGDNPTFSDPFGLGAVPSLMLATFAEFVCALCIVAGLFVRLSAVPLIVTMLTAVFIAHAGDPFAVREKAVLFLAGWVLLFFTGGGRYAVDAWLKNRTVR